MKIVLFSGGIDSTAALNHVARKYGTANTLALNIQYGSLHNIVEKQHATKIIKHLGVKGKSIKLPEEIFKGAGSALMGESEMPDGEYRKEGPQDTVVPFRNGTMLSVAAAIAFRHLPAEVWMAAHSDDGENWAYPDCRPEFLEAMDEAFIVASMGDLRLVAPFQWKTKADIVEQAAKERAPLELSYSCYRGEAIHCGECATCIDRHDAFTLAGYSDPTEYRIRFMHHLDAKEWPNG